MLSTTREGGVSSRAFDSLNLGNHVGDEPSSVAQNREILTGATGGQRVFWLHQVHGTNVIRVDESLGDSKVVEGDASITSTPGIALAVMTADCLPVVVWDQKGEEIGAAHAGWRGLAEGVLENLVQSFKASPEELIAWLGPAIGPTAFEVGPEVRERFLALASQKAEVEEAFRPSEREGHYLADIYALATMRLREAGVKAVHKEEEFCTVLEEKRFFSYRREGRTGRMATLIWKEQV